MNIWSALKQTCSTVHTVGKRINSASRLTCSAQLPAADIMAAAEVATPVRRLRRVLTPLPSHQIAAKRYDEELVSCATLFQMHSAVIYTTTFGFGDIRGRLIHADYVRPGTAKRNG